MMLFDIMQQYAHCILLYHSVLYLKATDKMSFTDLILDALEDTGMFKFAILWGKRMGLLWKGYNA